MINFYLPGISKNIGLNMTIVNIIKEHPEYFRPNLNIGAFYGVFPNSLWNGGRIPVYEEPYTTKDIKASIEFMQNNQIPIRFTFSNMLITETDLKDEFCNYCLQMAHNEKNAVILTSPLLEQYIRTNYPKYQIISSTCKCITNMTELRQELKSSYNFVVINQNLNNTKEIFNIDEKNKCEILINPACQDNCPIQKQHYLHISNQQKKIVNGETTVMRAMKEFQCPYVNNKSNTKYISSDALWNLYVPAGFSHFKIQGRNGTPQDLIPTYCDYFVLPQYISDVKVMLYESLIKSNLLQYAF